MIARMGKTRFIVCATLVLVVCAALIAVALGLNLPEATGKTVKKDGKMTVDCSNMSEGYLMVKAKKTSKRLKLQIATSGAKLNYDLNSDGEYEVFPLQFGSGKYQVSLFENVSGKKYSKEGTVKLNVKMPDELSCFLYPNQYVSYDENTAWRHEPGGDLRHRPQIRNEELQLRLYQERNGQARPAAPD